MFLLFRVLGDNTKPKITPGGHSRLAVFGGGWAGLGWALRHGWPFPPLGFWAGEKQTNMWLTTRRTNTNAQQKHACNRFSRSRPNSPQTPQDAPRRSPTRMDQITGVVAIHKRKRTRRRPRMPQDAPRGPKRPQDAPRHPRTPHRQKEDKFV